jgi:hypothetical protein
VIVTSIFDTTILAIMNAAIAGLPDLSRTFRELWGCLVEPTRDSGPYARDVTPIIDNNTAAGLLKVAMK